jgi:GDP-D-glucose phosphorylase
MVKVSEAIASGALLHSLPVLHIDESSIQDAACTQALNKFIRDALAKSNTKDAGVLLYTLPHTLDTRVLVGSSGDPFIVSSNPWRKMKRVAFTATEVSQPFDDTSFHFLKADVNECLAWLRVCWPGSAPSVAGATLIPETGCKADPHNDTLLLINNAPLTSSHFLVVPQPAARLPQVLTPYAVRVAVALCLSLAADTDNEDGSSDVLLGFNSICAFASVNHLHLHAYRLALAPQQRQELKQAKSGTIPALHRAATPLRCSPSFPVSISSGKMPGFRVDHLSNEASLQVLTAVIQTVQSHDCAHNVVFFSDDCGDASAVVYCRAKAVGVKDAASLNVAVSELSGHVFAKSCDAFEGYSGDELDALIAEIQLPPAVQRGICDDIVARVSLLQIESVGELQQLPEERVSSNPPSLDREQLVAAVSQLQALRSHLQQEMSVLKAQICDMKSASEDAKAALKLVAAASVQHQKIATVNIPQAAGSAGVPASALVKHVLCSFVALCTAFACHKYFGSWLFEAAFPQD